MLAFRKERLSLAGADRGLAGQADFQPPAPLRRRRSSAGLAGRLISCQIDDNLAWAYGQAWSYYLSNHDGRQMLILECRPGDHIRINGTMEAVILDIHRDQVKVAIQSLPDEAMQSQPRPLAREAAGEVPPDRPPGYPLR